MPTLLATAKLSATFKPFSNEIITFEVIALG
jgi:hypothetical protein